MPHAAQRSAPTQDDAPALPDRRRVLALALVPLGLTAAIAGSVFGLYDRVSWLDEVIHAFNFFTATLVVGLFLHGRVLDGGGRHRPLVVATLVLLGLGMGALWEIAEWGYDQTRATNAILGKTDTILDLLIDTGGAAVAALLVVAPGRGHRAGSPAPRRPTDAAHGAA